MELKLIEFLDNLATSEWEIVVNATGVDQIQQSQRNQLRKAGVKALMADLQSLYGDYCDVIETKEGIIVAVENETIDKTISFALPFTFKSTDYDPYIEGMKYDDEVARKEADKARRQAEKEEKAAAIKRKREAKLAEKGLA